MLVNALKRLFLCYVIYFFYFKAQKEIKSLIKQEDRLVKKRQRLQIKRQCYLQTLSQLCGKAVFQTGIIFFLHKLL